MSEGPSKLGELRSSRLPWTFPWLFHCNFDQLDEQAHSLVLTILSLSRCSLMFLFSLLYHISQIGLNTTGEQGHIINKHNNSI